MTLIEPKQAIEKYNEKLQELKKNLDKIGRTIEKANRDYQRGNITEEMYYLITDSLRNRANFLKKEFVDKYGFEPPQKYISNPYLTDRTLEKKFELDVRNMFTMNEINARIKKNRQNMNIMKFLHLKQIEFANSNTEIVRKLNDVPDEVAKAYNKFREFLENAVKLGIITNREMEYRLSSAMAEISTMNKRTPKVRIQNFIDSLIIQIQNISRKK